MLYFIEHQTTFTDKPIYPNICCLSSKLNFLLLTLYLATAIQHSSLAATAVINLVVHAQQNTN